MSAADHTARFEELMAWLDGELPDDEARRVQAHVSGCADCQQMEAEMRGVSGQMAQWNVAAAPATLGTVPAKRNVVVWSTWLPIAATLVVGVGAGVLWVGKTAHEAPPAEARFRTAAANESDRFADNKAASAGGQRRDARSELEAAGPLLVRTAQLTLVLQNLDAARAEMEKALLSVGGFAGNISATGSGTDQRTLSATLRVPTARLDETIAALKKLGQVRSESLQGEDVTQQSVDLDARLANARTSEKRLQDILANRTGKLADVLSVEREIARVRGEIEQMEAERKSLDRRVTYAVLALDLIETRKAAVNLGPLPVSTRLRNALVDGWTSAVTSALDLTVFVVRIAPMLLLWAIILIPSVRLLRRWLRTPRRPDTSNA
jgi:hypothetical protein